MMSTKWWYLVAGVAIGLVAAPQLRKLPVVGKIPTI